MSKKSCFRSPFNRQHGKWSQDPLKSARQHLYHIYWSLWWKLSWRKSLLVICKILGLFLNTLTAVDEYSLLYSNNLTKPIQMELFKKQKTVCQLFAACLKFWTFWKKKMLMYFRNDRLGKTWLDKCRKSPVSEHPSTGSMVNGPKYCENLHDSTFIIFIDHWEKYWIGKTLS